MYKYLLFDLDGTLADTKLGIFNGFNYAFEKLGEPTMTHEAMRPYIGPPLKSTLIGLGYDEEKVQRGVELYREYYNSIGIHELSPLPGGVEMFRALKEKGYIMAVASSKPTNMCVAICERFGYAPYLEHIVGLSGNDDLTKADIIRQVMDCFGLTAEDKPQMLMIGDRKYDVIGANECGIDCLGAEFFHYAEPGELMGEGAVATVETAEEAVAYIIAH